MSTRVRPCFLLLLLSSLPLLLVAGCGGVVQATGAAAPNPSPTSTQRQHALTSLTIKPGDLSLAAGATQQYAAVATFDDGASTLLTSGLQWTASTSAATLTSNGLLQTSTPGDLTVTVASGPLTASAHLTITSPPTAPASFQTSIAPLPSDDLAGPCAYNLLLPDPSHPVAATWVIFERADSLALWQDPALYALAARLHLSLLYAHQCNALSYPDIQSDGRRGPARALTSALTQLAARSNHPEIAQSNLVLFGFSAAGVLSLTTAESMPGRILTVITYAAGSAPLELRQLTPSAQLETIPILILGNAEDNMAGTSMSHAFFKAGRSAGAPWAFAIQPGVPHCCTLLAQPILLAWVNAVVPQRQADAAALPAPIDQTAGSAATYTCTPNNITDGRGYTDCKFTDASILLNAQPGDTASAWLPDPSAAISWLAWVHPPTP